MFSNGRCLSFMHKRFVPLCLFVFSLPFILVDSVRADDQKLWLDSGGHAPVVDIQLPSLAPLIEQLSAAVVNISVQGKESVKNPLEGLLIPGLPGGNGESPFEFAVPKNGQIERKFSSLGSGFVIHPDGYVVTNNHVVEKAMKIVVTFKDEKQTYTAKVVGRDKKTDIALLKIEDDKTFNSVVIGDSDIIKSGDWVIAIGNPFRLGHTATIGIVSAKSRRISAGPYDDYIQTDASINPGNSGGPLFNSKGEVVGVNTAIFGPGRMGGQTGFNIGIGFAIPINMVKNIVEQLHKSGKVTRGWLGVMIQPVSPDVAQAMGLKDVVGALVADVLDDSPAKKSGIERGDVIVSYDGKEVEANDQLPLMVAQTPIGKKVDVSVIRKNEKKKLSVEIEELKDDSSSSPSTQTDDETVEEKLGMSIQEITPELASSMGINRNVKGVVVIKVGVDGMAAMAGLRPADVIIEVDSKNVSTVSDFRSSIAKLDNGKPVLILVKRGENTIFLTLKKDLD